MRWTEDQREAIELRGKNLLVSAAAGSGKTALLIERIRRIVVTEGVPVDRLLVLTFTRAAASEMKDRLNKALMTELTAGEGDRAYVIRQINLLGSADISTLHAFCNTLIREYFQEAGVDPEFALMNDAERAIMLQETLDEVFEAAYLEIPEGGETDFSRLVEMFSGNRDDKALRALVEKFYQFLATQPDPEGWCRSALANFDLDEASFWQSSWGQVFKSEMAVALKGALALLERALDLCEDASGFEKTREQLAGDRTALSQVISALAGDYDLFRSLLCNLDFPRYKGAVKVDRELSDSIKDLRNEAKDIVKGWQAQNRASLSDALSLVAAMKQPVQTLIALTQTFKTRFSEKKLAKNLLDFNDLEAYALKILENPDIAEELRERFDYIFLDEYQDTNDMQEAIIQRIARKDNYFMVGDVKQSIYRFRLADPTIFIEKYLAFGRENSSENALVTLSKNFRSAAGVIDSVNAVFERIMSQALGEVDYDRAARLYKGLEAEGDYRKSEVYILEQPDSVLDEEDQEVSAVEAEAYFVAKKIQSQVGRPFFDTKAGVIRNLEYRDVSVLMRTISGKGDVFARVFSKQGIPAYYDGGSNYYESLEIGVIMNLLKLIDNRRQDLPLLAVMTSPVGNFTLEECSDIRIYDREHCYYAAVEAYMADHDDALAEKLKAFYADLDRWREASRVKDVERFLWQLYMETGYYYFVGALPGGDARQANLQLLLKRAADYKASTLRGIFYFIQFVERMKKSGSDMGAPSILSEQENVVRIMTVHKSKGLEFPLVFLAGTGTRFNKRDNSGRILFHKTLGICPEYVDLKNRARVETLAQNICAAQNGVEMLSEEMRLLYVAMTRAQEAFVAVGSVKCKDLPKKYALWQGGTSVYQLKKAAGPLDWLMEAVEANHPVPLSQTVKMLETDCFKVQVLSREESLAAETFPEEALREGEFPADTAIDAEVDRRLGFIYPEILEEAPGKITVTELQRLRRSETVAETEERLPRPAFMEAEDDVWTAAQRGTAVHVLLQHLTLDEIRKVIGSDDAAVLEALEAQRQRLISREFLPEGLARTIDLSIVLKFLRTSLFDRMLRSIKIKREWPFYFTVPAGEVGPLWEGEDAPVLVQGMIDCAFLEEDGWVLLDYKTDRFSGPAGRETVVARYRDQIEFYAKALASLTGRPVKEKVLCLVRMGEWITL